MIVTVPIPDYPGLGVALVVLLVYMAYQAYRWFVGLSPLS